MYFVWRVDKELTQESPYTLTVQVWSNLPEPATILGDS